ncbi:hypothetical protein C0J52_12253 [Blattella germanica]|nr:hypothetical protein C0J52_12253 [Blattella germanica]
MSAVKLDLKEESLKQWENEWKNTTKGEITKSFFPSVKSRLNTKLNLTHNTTAILTGHENFGAYQHKFKIKDDANCMCKCIQTVNHLLWECEILKDERQELCKYRIGPNKSRPRI